MGGSDGIDPATIREFVARTRPLCDAATPLQEARSGSIYTESGEWLAEFAFSRDAAFTADARKSLPKALGIIEALLAERERDAPAIRAAVHITTIPDDLLIAEAVRRNLEGRIVDAAWEGTR